MSPLLLLVLLTLPQAEAQPPAKAEPTEGELILEKVQRALASNVVVRFTVNTENQTWMTFENGGAECRTQVTLATLDLRPGNRLTIDGRFPIGELKWPAVPNQADSDWMILESDGKSMKVTPYSGSEAARMDTPKRLNENLLRDFLYLGVRQSVVERLKTLTQSKPSRDAELLRDSAVTLLGREKLDEKEVLKLELKPRKSTGPATTSTFLWIDAKTHLPLRREARTQGAAWHKVDTERYNEFGTDPFN